MLTCSKDLNAVREEQNYFETHTTEAAADLRMFLTYLAPLKNGTGPLRMLDYGCGAGTLTAKLLAQAGITKSRLQLTLVESAAPYRAMAVSRAQPYTFNTITSWPSLQAGGNTRYEVILANHSLYYPTDLNQTLGQMLLDLAPGGIFMTTIAGRSNVLVQFLIQAFALVSQPFPHHLAEEVESTLKSYREKFMKQQVQYELVFEDKEPNRLKILRLLLGSYFSFMPQKALLAFFNPYVTYGRIVIKTEHTQFVVRR